MDEQTDDRDTGLPPVGSPEELEEALKWLEDLTARQGKSPDLANPIPSTSIDSPFHGLIDSAEGDLPDWLREVPKPLESDAYDESEPESRLDWLAKMAQRESIEELPTLEWRRLTEPLQGALVPEDSALIEELRSAEDPAVADESLAVEEAPPVVPVEATTGGEASLPHPPDSGEAPVLGDEISLSGPEHEPPTWPVEEIPAIVTLAEEDLVESITLDADEELPPLDDLDAAMAWIEELAASQQAPIEDIPSVGDRALASKLMMEAGMSPIVLPLDELGSDSALVESMTPTHPFIEEEDFADTVVLVETMAADQGLVMEMPEETLIPAAGVVGDEAMVAGSGAAVYDVPTHGEAPAAPPAEELSFDEAMAYLDELAVVNILHDEVAIEPLPSEPVGIAAIPVVEAAGEESPPAAEEFLSSAAAPWADSATIEAEDDDMPDEAVWAPPAVVELAVAQEHEVELAVAEEDFEELVDAEEFVQEAAVVTETQYEPELEARLSDLDNLALPPGQTLSGIAAALNAAHITPARDLSSALTWLESRLATGPVVPAPMDLDETDLIAQMPEDPDEVLAWLERIAGEEVENSAAQGADYVGGGDRSPAALAAVSDVAEITETDLFDMPDDPDEAMAWLESLSRRERPPATSSAAPDVPDRIEPQALAPEVVEQIAPDAPPLTDEAEEPVSPDTDIQPWEQEFAAPERVEWDEPAPPEPDVEPVAHDATPFHAEPAEPLARTPEDVEAEEIVVPWSETPATAPLEDEVMTEPAPLKPAGRRRASAKQSLPAEVQPLEEQPPEVQEPTPPPAPEVPAEERPVEKKPATSWIDLLKPLE